MKNLSIIILLLLPVMVMGQNMKEMYNQYIEYCNMVVTDTITESGQLSAAKEVPVYGTCGDIVSYKEVLTGDTTWNGYKCKEYKNNLSFWVYGASIICDSIATSKWGHITLRPVKVCTVSRKHVCHIKQEKPSSEGFYEWMFKKLKTIE